MHSRHKTRVNAIDIRVYSMTYSLKRCVGPSSSPRLSTHCGHSPRQAMPHSGFAEPEVRCARELNALSEVGSADQAVTHWNAFAGLGAYLPECLEGCLATILRQKSKQQTRQNAAIRLHPLTVSLRQQESSG